VIRTSKTIILPGFAGYSLFEIWRPFLEQLRKTSLAERAAAISFNVVMAIPPVLIFVFTLIPYFPISNRVIQELYSLIRDIVPGEKNNSIIINFLEDFIKRPRNELLSFGLLLALFFSSNAMIGILRSFDKNYPGFGKRTGLQKRQTALQLTMVAFTLVFLCILLLIAQDAVLAWLGVKSEILRLIITNVRWIILVLLTFYVVAIIYRHGPAHLQKWPFLTPGAVFATSLMFIATFIVSFWINNFSNYNKLYGSISAIFILMSLIYVNALVILLGFELNVTITSLKRQVLEKVNSKMEE
jgi:membrane protein